MGGGARRGTVCRAVWVVISGGGGRGARRLRALAGTSVEKWQYDGRNIGSVSNGESQDRSSALAEGIYT